MTSWSITTTGVPCSWRWPGVAGCQASARAVEHLDLVVAEVLPRERLHHLAALVVEPLELARLVAGQRVVREDRHGDGGVGVAHHGVGQAVRVHLAPAHGFARRGAAQAAGVGPRVGHLQEVILAEFLDAQHFLDLRLGLEHEVLRAAAAPQHHARSCRRARLAASTKAVVSLTSMDGLMRSLLPRSSTPATFMPMVESPGEEV